MPPGEPTAFTTIVATLERAYGRPLRGRGRIKCLRAFQESSEGFAAVAREALARGRRNPLGLLCAMVDEKDHLFDGWKAEANEPSAEPERGPGRCVVCDRFVEDALVWGGQFWCADHESNTREDLGVELRAIP